MAASIGMLSCAAAAFAQSASPPSLATTCVDPLGKPMVGATVELHLGGYDPASWRRQTTHTDANGVATFPPPATGEDTLTWLIGRAATGLGGRRWEATRKTSTEPGPLVLWPRRGVRGSVVVPPDHDAQVSVSVTWFGGTFLDRRVDRFQVQGIARVRTSDDAAWLPPLVGFDAVVGRDGTWALPDVAGDSLVLEFRSPGLAHQRVAVSPTTTDLRVELAAEARCTIRVAPVQGMQTVGLRLVLTKDEGHGFPDVHTATRDLPLGERLEATCTALPAGDYHLTVRADDAAVHLQAVQLVRGRTLEVTVQLTTGVLISGTVRDQHGRSVAGARVQASPADEHFLWNVGEACSDATGAFRVRVPRRGLLLQVAELPDGFDTANDAKSLPLTVDSAPTANLNFVVRRR